MGFKTQDGFQFTGSGAGLKYVSGKRISFYISEQGDPGSGDAGGYPGTPGIVSTNIVLDLNATNSSSYGGSGTTWSDISGSGNNGTLVNGVTYNSGDGGYLIFDGTDDKATLPAGSDFAYGTGDFTVEMWFNVTGTSPQTWGERLFCQTVSGTNYFLISVAESNPPTKYVRFVHGTSGGGTAITSSTTYTEGTWYHLVVTRNGTTLTMYLNNSLVATATVTQDFSNTTYVPTIGAMTHSNNHNLDGKISQVRVYKGKGFSASDVLQNYNATKLNYTGIITTNLVLHLDASNSSSYSGSGTTWTDLTGNGYNGTLINGVTYNSGDGGYLDFDGSNDRVDFSSYVQPAHTSSTSFTWFIWVYPSETNTDDVIMGNRNVSGSNKWTKLTPRRFEWNYPDHLDGTGTNVTTNQWQNICITKNGSSFTYYKNGSSIDTVTSSASKDSNPFYLGGDPVYGEYTNCRISIVAVYDAALSASEVLQNYNATKSNYV